MHHQALASSGIMRGDTTVLVETPEQLLMSKRAQQGSISITPAPSPQVPF